MKAHNSSQVIIDKDMATHLGGKQKRASSTRDADNAGWQSVGE